MKTRGSATFIFSANDSKSHLDACIFRDKKYFIGIDCNYTNGCFYYIDNKKIL